MPDVVDPIRAHAVCPDLVDTGMMREHADNPEYALGFSGTKIYTPEEISDEIVKLLDSDKIVLSIPRNRMVVARMAGLFPRTGLRLAPDRPWRFWLAGEPSVSAYRRHPKAVSAPPDLVSSEDVL